MQEKAMKCFTLLIYIGAAVGGIWLSIRFILPWAAPFLLAMALASLMEPAVRAMSRRGIKRSFAAGVMTLGLLAFAGWIIFALTSKGISAATDFAKQVPELMDRAGKSMEGLENRLLIFVSSVPESVQSYMKTAMDAVGAALYGLPAHISRRMLDFLTVAAQKSPSTLLFAVTAGIGSYFFSASYPSTMAFLSAQLPESLRNKIKLLSKELKTSLGGFFRAQGILMAMSFFELLLAFLLLGIDGAVGIAAVTALIDALPVFGTGVVLVPWAIYCLVLGNYGRALGLLISWGVVNLIRSCTQAKLMGDEIGLNPIVSLAAVYVGWKVWGVWGMLLFPLLFSVLQQLNDKEIIKLWKNI